MRKYFLLVLLIIFLVISAVATIRFLSGEDNWICVNNQWVKHGNPSSPAPKTGCGEKVLTPTVSQQINEPLTQQIIKALSAKNNWDESKVELNVQTVEEDYAKGDVKFKGEMGGGLWFAAKVNGTWKIVYDGNGMILCENLTNYPNFPKSLIPQCFDKNTNNMVIR